MALDFGDKQLFKKTGLEQETGVLSNRWGQDGSSIVNIHDTNTSDKTLYTVTTGKRLYITTMVVSEIGSGGDGNLKDGGAAGATRVAYANGGAGTLVLNFDTPIYFDTDVYHDEVGALSGTITLTGWEEDAP